MLPWLPLRYNFPKITVYTSISFFIFVHLLQCTLHYEKEHSDPWIFTGLHRHRGKESEDFTRSNSADWSGKRVLWSHTGGPSTLILTTALSLSAFLWASFAGPYTTDVWQGVCLIPYSASVFQGILVNGYLDDLLLMKKSGDELFHMKCAWLKPHVPYCVPAFHIPQVRKIVNHV